MGPLDYKNNKLSNCVIKRGPSILEVPHRAPSCFDKRERGHVPYRKPSALPSREENGLQPCLLPEDSDNVSEKSLGLLVRGNSDVRSKGGRTSSVLPSPRPQGALDQHPGVSSSSGSGIRTGRLLLFSAMSP